MLAGGMPPKRIQEAGFDLTLHRIAKHTIAKLLFAARGGLSSPAGTISPALS